MMTSGLNVMAPKIGKMIKMANIYVSGHGAIDMSQKTPVVKERTSDYKPPLTMVIKKNPALVKNHPMTQSSPTLKRKIF